MKLELGPLQKKWIEELKSEKYKQGKGCLYDKNSDSYCCLGVANKVCELGELFEGTLVTTFKKIGLYNNEGSSSDGSYSLISMNDFGNSFKDIAKIMEKYPSRYFKESK